MENDTRNIDRLSHWRMKMSDEHDPHFKYPEYSNDHADDYDCLVAIMVGLVWGFTMGALVTYAVLEFYL